MSTNIALVTGDRARGPQPEAPTSEEFACNQRPAVYGPESLIAFMPLMPHLWSQKRMIIMMRQDSPEPVGARHLPARRLLSWRSPSLNE